MPSPILGNGWICLAAYRPDLDLLSIQIDSIRSQSVSTWRCAIGIDGKDPAVREAITRLVAGDSRFSVYEFPENVGFYRNFERLLARIPADVDWVALSDQDDEWFPEKLETLLPLLGSASLAFGQAFVVDIARSSDAPALAVRRSAGLTAALIDNQVTGCMSVFRRDLVDLALPFPDETDAAFHDHWLGLCALALDGVGVTMKPLQNYVQHGANVIGEEGRTGLGNRLRRLANVSKKGQASGVDYISEHRWGWRVSMAKTLLHRLPSGRLADRRVLNVVACDRLTPRLLRMWIGEAVAGRAPKLRTLGLLLGAARSPRRRALNLPAGPLPEVSRAMALEVLESCAVGDHVFHSMPALRALRGFQQIVWSSIRRTRAAAACTLPSSQVVLVAANPVAHGARLMASIRESVRSSTFSVLADGRLGEKGLLIEHSFPGISANSLIGFVSRQRLVFAVRLRLKLHRGTALVGSANRLYREYLFIAQAVRYAACLDGVAKLPQTTVLVTDYDRATYCRPWVWAANSAGMKTVTMMHGSPNEANYVPVLAQHSLVWGAVQKHWIEQRNPDVAVQVVGRPDLQREQLARPGITPRVVLCHSREQLSVRETESLIEHLAKLRNDGYQITVRLHPSATASALDEQWRKVASLAHDVVVSRGSFVSSLSGNDLVICIVSSAAVEAIAAGVPAVVIADDSRILPSDLEAVRSASPEMLREFAAQKGAATASTPYLDGLASRLLEATGAQAGHLLDLALVKIRG